MLNRITLENKITVSILCGAFVVIFKASPIYFARPVYLENTLTITCTYIIEALYIY